MRSDLPAHVADTLARAHGPTLVFDRAAIAANLERCARAARAHGIRVLFAAKSFPHAEVRALAAAHLDGFDVASPGELAEIPPAQLVSIADPSGAALAHAATARARRVIVACETVEHVRAAPPGADLALRISASLTGRDPAVGAILDGSGHRRSRFGVDHPDELRALAAAAAGRRIGLHVHHGPVLATTSERFLATARAALAAAHTADLAPAFLDLGGAWHGIPDLAATFAALRAALPADLELLVEPGRLFALGAGYATGRVTSARALPDRDLVTTELSRICHLRWGQLDLVAPAPHPGRGRITLVVGPTCFEEDALGEWTVDPAQVAERIVVRGVTGYALAWNTGFAGVPPAAVTLT